MRAVVRPFSVAARESPTWRARSRSLRAAAYWSRRLLSLARALITIVCVAHQDGKMSAVPIPAEIGNKIEVAPADVLAS